MPIFIIETTAESPIREFWQVEAETADQARENFEAGEVGAFLWDEVTGDETDRDVSEVHPFADLAGTIALHYAQREASAMLAALRSIGRDDDGDGMLDAAGMDRIKAILDRIDGAPPTDEPCATCEELGSCQQHPLCPVCDGCGVEEVNGDCRQCSECLGECRATPTAQPAVAADAFAAHALDTLKDCEAWLANGGEVDGVFFDDASLLDRVRESLALAAPSAQPAAPIAGDLRGLLFDIRDFLAGFEDCEDNGELVQGLQERIARATEGRTDRPAYKPVADFAGHAAAIEAAQGYVSNPVQWNPPSPAQVAHLLQLSGIAHGAIDSDLAEAAAGDTCRACNRASIECSRAPCPTVIAERGEG